MAAAAGQGVVANAADQNIVAAGAVEDVCAAGAEQDVVSARACAALAALLEDRDGRGGLRDAV